MNKSRRLDHLKNEAKDFLGKNNLSEMTSHCRDLYQEQLHVHNNNNNNDDDGGCNVFLEGCMTDKKSNRLANKHPQFVLTKPSIMNRSLNTISIEVDEV